MRGGIAHKTLPLVVLFGISYVWYGWLFTDQPMHDFGLVGVGTLGLLPIALAITYTLSVSELSIYGILAIATAMFLAQPVAYYPHSPDGAFHLGKILWAARGERLLDPAMGIPSPYPWIYHYLWGEVSRLTSTSVGPLLRWNAVWNVGGIILVGRLLTRRLGSKETMHWVPWLCALGLFAKDSSHILLPGPGGFSFPIALAGLWMWLSYDSRWTIMIAGVLCAISAVIWPGNLFWLGGISLVLLVRQPREFRTHVLASATVLSTAAVWTLRLVSHPSASFTNIGLVPQVGIADVPRVFVHLISIGADANGLVPAAGAIGITVLFAFLVRLGWRQVPRGNRKSLYGNVAVGLLLATVGVVWVMRMPAYWSRVFSLGALMATPIAAIGLRYAIDAMSWPHLNMKHVALFALGSVWLIPFLAASVVNSRWEADWQIHCAPTTYELSKLARPGDRVWATPESMRNVVLGQLQLQGFLGHEWSRYFGMPEHVADSIHEVFVKLKDEQLADVENLDDLRKAGVDYVLIKCGNEEKTVLGKRLHRLCKPAIKDSCFAVYAISER